jgi:uncharacterized protein Yka (UPF0111/DUF47 family)
MNNAAFKETQELRNRLERLRAKLAERQASIPIHSVRPHQLIEIEELEEEIAKIEERLRPS